jgi:preprotein translocase SecE subunit
MLVEKTKKYLKEVIEEYKKVIFPGKKDVYTTSIYIVVVIFITACLIALTDFLISSIIKIIFGLS